MRARLIYENIDRIDEVFQKYISDTKFRNSILIQAVNDNFVIHATEVDFDKFDTEYVRGGVRANYGYGFYFTDNIYKISEYSESPEKYKFCNISNMNILDLTATPESIGLETISEKLELMNVEKYRLENYLDNVRSNAEYDFYTTQIKEIDDTIKELSTNSIPYIDYIEKIISDNRDKSFYVINNIIKRNPVNLEKLISEYFLSIGFDGFNYGYEYVIFNMDKLNKYTEKDIKTFVSKIYEELV